MTEQQIRDGYQQLDSALVPPVDAHVRVARRVAVRRRRRRLALAGGAVVSAVAIVGSVVAVTGGEDGSDRLVAVDPPAEESVLVLTRPDGSTYAFSDLTVTCKEPAVGGSVKPGNGIWLSSPIRFSKDESGEEEGLEQPFVLFEGRLDKLQEDRTFTLPVDGPGGSDSYAMTLFVADTEGAPDGNEVVSSGNSSGTVRVLRASCEPTPVLELEIDVTLGSEEGKQPLDLAGSVG